MLWGENREKTGSQTQDTSGLSHQCSATEAQQLEKFPVSKMLRARQAAHTQQNRCIEVEFKGHALAHEQHGSFAYVSIYFWGTEKVWLVELS